MLGIPLKQFTFEDCTFTFVLTFRNWLLDAEGRAPSTVNQRMAALKAYLHYCASRETSLVQIRLAVDEVPFLREPVKVRDIIEDPEALKAFLGAPPNTATGRRDTAILALLFDAALRLDELTSLRIGDVNLDTDIPHVLVHGKGSKERLAPIADETATLLRSYITERCSEMQQDAPLFFTTWNHEYHSMSNRNVQRIVQKYADIARKEHPSIPEKVHPHMLRRTRTTLLYRDGVPIEMLAVTLGHASVQTTIDHYASPSMEQRRHAVGAAQGVVAVPQDAPEWPDDDAEFARVCGLR